MSAPAPDEGPITSINVFDIAEDEIDTFVSEWEERSRFIARAEGFISAELHRAIEPGTRFKVVNVSRWESLACMRAALTAPDYRADLDRYTAASTWTPHRGVYRSVAKLE